MGWLGLETGVIAVESNRVCALMGLGSKTYFDLSVIRGRYLRNQSVFWKHLVVNHNFC